MLNQTKDYAWDLRPTRSSLRSGTAITQPRSIAVRLHHSNRWAFAQSPTASATSAGCRKPGLVRRWKRDTPVRMSPTGP